MVSEPEKEPQALEAGMLTQPQVGAAGPTIAKAKLDGEEATWDGDDDPNDPYNWPDSRKTLIGIVASSSQLVTTMSASMIAPALPQILHDVGMSISSGQIAFSVFFLGLGFTPFIIAPIAEMYGRRRIWLFGNVWFILWNSLSPVGNNAGLMIAGRFLSASGASVGITTTAPMMADMYQSKERGRSLAIATILPYIGPALGPIVGGLSAQHLWWPWLFWILSFFDCACLVAGYFVIKETYAPVLLRRKARAKYQADTDGKKTFKTSYSTRMRLFSRDLMSRIGPAIWIPVQLLIMRPIIQIITVTVGLGFGIYTLILGTYADIFITKYHQSSSIASLHYISIAIGAFVCAQVGGRLMDLMYKRHCAKRPAVEPTPEFRLSYMLVGFVPGLCGIFLYAWAAEYKLHWAVLDVGAALFTCGDFMFSQGLMAYLIDEVQSKRAASGSAATRLLSYVFGFAFPIFAPQLYAGLGYGWGASLLGFIWLVMGVLLLAVLHRWGPELRAIGRTDG